MSAAVAASVICRGSKSSGGYRREDPFQITGPIPFSLLLLPIFIIVKEVHIHFLLVFINRRG
jgi:hypothetical protein